MHKDTGGRAPVLSRRAFLAMAGAGLGGTTLALISPDDYSDEDPLRGGVLRFASRYDALGLDPHRYLWNPASVPLAATMQGLVDLNLHSEPVPGIAAEWDASSDLLTYTFKLRHGVTFHNGREVDAAAVKWNFLRMQDPKTSHPFIRSALQNLQATEAVGRYTVRFHLHQPSVAFPADVAYYPCSLIAPAPHAQIQRRPHGCGPFRFVRWERDQVTAMRRFEHYFETDAAGNALPYLDGIEGRPKHVDAVRFMRLRAGQVDLMETVATIDTKTFAEYYARRFQFWNVPILGTSYLLFNLHTGPFADKRLRQAAAHAIDHDELKQVVFYSRGETARSFYASISPWYAVGVRSWPTYDPDQARFLLRQARAVGTTVVLQSLRTSPYAQQTAALIQGMWSDVGFKVVHKIYDTQELNQKRQARAFHAESTAASYRFDPDGWFSRYLHSKATSTRATSGFRHAQVDTLIDTARSAPDKLKRLELYAEIDSIINQELPILYLHHLTLFEVGVMHLNGYQPAISGLFSTQGAGIRTAWLA